MTLLCIDHSQSKAHNKASFLQDGNINNINNNLNQNANNHVRRNSCSPTLMKTPQHTEVLKNLEQAPARKLERSVSEPLQDKQRSVQPTTSNTSRYKTELCRPFEESGTCKYGDKCQFAHGSKELRTMARHPKYKTELCRTFHSSGLCPYGPRCHFIHNSEQAKKNLLNNLTGTSPNRPKALGSLGSAGDVSPPSSHGGTPTTLKSFDELFQSPNFALTQEYATLQRFIDIPLRTDYNPDPFGSESVTLPDIGIDNYSFQSSPVLDLYQTTPASPLDINVNTSCFRLPIFDLFHK